MLPARPASIHLNGDDVPTHSDHNDYAKYRAKRYAVKYDPPCVYLEYEEPSGKRRVRAVKLTCIPEGTDTDKLTRKVIRSFPRKLDPTSVKYDQVRKLVSKILDHQSKSGWPDVPSLTPSLSPTPLGHTGPRVLRDTQVSTESRFTTSSTLSDSGNSHEDDLAAALSELDKEMTDFSSPSRPYGSLPSPTSSCDVSKHTSTATPADSMSRASSTLSLKDTTAHASIHTHAQHSSQSGPSASSKPASRFAAEADRLVLDLDIEITEDLDLNKVTEVELKLAKQKMDEDFQKNRLKPGDPGYQYDKQVEFGPPKQANDWDDSGDDGAEAEDEDPVDWTVIQSSVSKKPEAKSFPVTSLSTSGSGHSSPVSLQ